MGEITFTLAALRWDAGMCPGLDSGYWHVLLALPMWPVGVSGD